MGSRGHRQLPRILRCLGRLKRNLNGRVELPLTWTPVWHGFLDHIERAHITQTQGFVRIVLSRMPHHDDREIMQSSLDLSQEASATLPSLGFTHFTPWRGQAVHAQRHTRESKVVSEINSVLGDTTEGQTDREISAKRAIETLNVREKDNETHGVPNKLQDSRFPVPRAPMMRVRPLAKLKL
jgi:hypothetical protein